MLLTAAFALALSLPSLQQPAAAELARLGARQAAEPLFDYGMTQGADRYWEAAPADTQAASRLLAAAYRAGLPVRFRGRGHSVNGSSVPQEAELLLSSDRLREFRFDAYGWVTVGAGASVQAVERMLRGFGFSLPVTNEGGPGPSVGGFISAGGIGNGSAKHGGFWQNVGEVTLVDGTGKIHTLMPADAAFAWLFGSMGQLGFITQARLRILPLATSSIYPAGRTGSITEGGLPDAGEQLASGEVAIGYTTFVPAENLLTDLISITGFQVLYPEAFRYRMPAAFPIRAGGVHPPLVYPYPHDAVAIVLWGTLYDLEAARELDRALDAFIAGRPGYRRYVQFEPAKDDYRRPWGPGIYDQFHAWKLRFDPAFLLNRDKVFGAR